MQTIAVPHALVDSEGARALEVSRGEIVFEDLAARYRPGLDEVLKGVNLHIRAGSRVGVVGRTGSGKSTLLLVLFRIIEPSRGRVLIDGQDIARLGLQRLRGRSQPPQIAAAQQKMDPAQLCRQAVSCRALHRSLRSSH